VTVVAFVAWEALSRPAATWPALAGQDRSEDYSFRASNLTEAA
jgi:hypothetical protein